MVGGNRLSLQHSIRRLPSMGEDMRAIPQKHPLPFTLKKRITGTSISYAACMRAVGTDIMGEGRSYQSGTLSHPASERDYSNQQASKLDQIEQTEIPFKDCSQSQPDSRCTVTVGRHIV